MGPAFGLASFAVATLDFALSVSDWSLILWEGARAFGRRLAFVRGKSMSLSLKSIAALAGLAGLASQAIAQPGGETLPYEDPRLQSLATVELTQFAGDHDFRRYLHRVGELAEEWGLYWADDLMSKSKPSLPSWACDDDEGDACDTIVVTGSRIATPNPVITNNQTVGVDEGDIVKQIGDFLVVLQDGRLFSVNLQPDGAPGLAFTDRLDVYVDPERRVWIDEMLVTDNRIIVTGYSYEDQASEVTVLEMDATGYFSRLGSFLISSSDYYDVDNYATRIIDGRLVIHMPYQVSDMDSIDPAGWPVLRRWTSEDGQPDNRRPLFDAREIYRPVLPIIEPAIHTISVCELGRGDQADLDCQTQAFIAGPTSELYVSGEHAYLWTGGSWEGYYADDLPVRGRSCTMRETLTPEMVPPGGIYRMSLETGDLAVVGTRGFPFDQFSFAEYGGQLRNLVALEDAHCAYDSLGDREFDRAITQVSLISIPDRAFSTRFREAASDRYTALPGAESGTGLENRFTGTHLVYGWSVVENGDAPWWDETARKPAHLMMVPLDDPTNTSSLTLTHSLLRLETIDTGLIATGYVHREGLRVSHLTTTDGLQRAATTLLPGRLETEGRSHAFNFTRRADGTALLGLPTELEPGPAFRYWWRSTASELSFLSLDDETGFTALGTLEPLSDDAAEHPDYECEVSCIDWYGNSRPIFTQGRIFALLSTEIVEGGLSGDRIKPVRRVDLTAPLPIRPNRQAASTHTMDGSGAN